MRVKLLALLLMVSVMLVGLAGCTISFSNPVEKRKESISKYISSDVAVATGDTYKTKWFEFTIHSIDKVDIYADHKAKEGYQLYQVLITLKNTWSASITMGLFDFYMDAPGFSEYVWAIPPLNDAMMPEKFDLNPGATVQYTLVFEVQTNTTQLALLYTETNENGNDGATFSVAIDS